MKWLFGQPARGHWRLLKPSRVAARGLAVSEGGDHGLIPTAKVGVGLELILETGPGLALEIGAGPTPEASLGIMLGADSQSCSHGDLWGMHPWSPDEHLPRGRVSFHDPKDEKDPIKEEASCSTEPSIDNLETWLEFQAGQLGTPTWWEELGAMPGIEDWCKFAQKIRASFYVLEVWVEGVPGVGLYCASGPLEFEWKHLPSGKTHLPGC